MVVTLPGELMANVQQRVEVESKLETGLAPIPRQAAAGRTVVSWDPVLKPGNVTNSNVEKNLVSGVVLTRMKVLCVI